ncbi:alkene reductase [Methylosinus sp. PW1]|uniref:alkene reductase n=1 Tax=Methylosinus sp. PW1 TaxID=107636 RepID=UPI00056402AF|nr:alkene reductase [Methylosinus sp. PW1]
MTVSLFEPFRLGDLTLANRIVMAPLTRRRATHETNAANALMAEHYRQRASAGLIIAEASQISQQGQGYAYTPGIYSPEQVAGWRQVTEAVHAAGGRIVLQLWHVGRVSHVSLQPGGGAPVAPSAIATTKQVAIETGAADCSAPRALELAEIPGLIADYRKAARNAKEAGFDGVEVHCANGYLIDEFLRDGSNKREDAYGGAPQNRARFGLEVVDAVLAEWDASRVGVRISPVSPVYDMSDSDPQSVFGYFVERLAERKLGFLHVIEGATQGPRDVAPFDYLALRKSFPGAYIANNAYTLELAQETLASGRADLIAFGRPFISNPDLVERLRRRAPLTDVDFETVYGAGAKGYTDYPTLTA